MRLRALLVIGLGLLAACEKPATTYRPGDCLPLPGAARSNLRADPRGGGLYWFEPVRRFDFDAELVWYWKLVRYDLHARRLDTLEDHVEAPIYFLGDKILVVRTNDKRKLVLHARGGRSQEVLPAYLSPLDAELIDEDSLAVLADGDGPRAVYTLDLDRPRPHLLVEADTLLSSKDGMVYAWRAGEGIAANAATGELSSFAQKSRAMPLGDELMYAEGDEVIALSMAHGTSRTVIPERRPWKLVHQPGAVLARTRPAGGRSYATLIEPGRVTPLATLVGGTTIVGVTSIGPQRWGLVAHDTSNYDGDIVDADAETEVCLLPDDGDVTFKSRTVPARYAHKQHALASAVARVAPGAAFQILDYAGAATSVFIELPELGGEDLEEMRKRVTQLHEQVTSLLEDREVMTETRYADLRTAAYRWRRSRLRARASAGMGDVTIADAGNYDLEVTDLVNTVEGEELTCAGTLTNLTKTTLTDLEVRCMVGDRDTVIRIPELGAGSTHRFAETFEVAADEQALFEVIHKREPLEILDRTVDKRQRDLLALALRVYRDTELALLAHEIGAEVTVQLLARRGFDRRSEAERAQAVERAYEAYDKGLRALYTIDEATAIELTIDVDHSEVSYTYDGERLHAND